MAAPVPVAVRSPHQERAALGQVPTVPVAAYAPPEVVPAAAAAAVPEAVRAPAQADQLRQLQEECARMELELYALGATHADLWAGANPFAEPTCAERLWGAPGLAADLHRRRELWFDLVAARAELEWLRL
jgi:hypothetical protein